MLVISHNQVNYKLVLKMNEYLDYKLTCKTVQYSNLSKNFYTHENHTHNSLITTVEKKKNTEI